MARALSTCVMPCCCSIMAFSISNALRYPHPQIALRNSLRTPKSPSFVRLPLGRVLQSRIVIRAASSAAGNPQSDADFNPYEVLGVNPIEGFDKIKQTYGRKLKDAQRSGDEATAALLEKAYDKLMYAQLMNRKKGVTFGSFKVSKDIKYADKQPIIPWGPRFSRSSRNDMLINLAISVVFSAWIAIKRNVEYKPLQFMSFVFVYRIFEKLKSFEAPSSPIYNEEGEESGRGLRMGKRLLRSLSLVFGSILVASLAYTGFLNGIEYMGKSIPMVLYNNQELIVTASSAFMLYVIASYYR
ncbi:unnamed protein product [Arabidopsis lyrata]|uniref:uncharacterized protein LOC9328528 n=1 Tax=Arabidopsis lyrata subsp. lyrata TaxID=81972 RepID=UPI000A29AFFF|nr:uncharacterized protein LOC9328528 [Arabidopsis lyrata subsp. lyrata]CAH8251606.1 unnamed protein product [Arabidopsis lyrata]|eukprot:XP_020866321.1 uncharacterized protein LOC9328528 [Arabidopsis lyrata subsp. lyrata]